MLFRHYLKLAFRNFRRHKSSFFINLIGLSTGLACTLFISLWVMDELQMNKFHEKEERLFQIMEHQHYSDRIGTSWSTPGLLAKTITEEVPEFEYAITMNWQSNYTLSVQDKNFNLKGHYVSKDFFHVFSFKLLEGQINQVLKEPNACVISKSTAIKLFGSPDNVVGKTVQFNHEEDLSITGVFEDTPSNSSMQFDILLAYEKYFKANKWLSSWGSNSPPTYAILKEDVNPEMLSKKIANFIKEREEDSNVTLFLKKFSDNYLYGDYENGKPTGGRIEYVRLFSIIAVFILMIACINFMNLSTARASRRAKEVGVKKAVGAQKEDLIIQYLSESVLLAFLSFGLAIAIVLSFMAGFNELTDKQLSLDLDPKFLLAFTGITLLTGLFAGSYPALYLSSFNPATVLKGTIKTSLGELWARRGLVVFQFTVSIIFIVAVLVVFQQIQFVQSKNLGYEKDNLIYFRESGTVETQKEVFMQELRKLPSVKAVSASSHDLLGRQNNTSGLTWPNKNPDERILFENIRVDYGFLKTIGLELKEGRSYSKEFGADSTKIIFNEAAIKIMGMTDPIGKKIRLWEEYDLEIIGVVKDFHFQSFHSEVKPLFFWLNPQNTGVLMARLEAGREKEALASIQNFYEKFNPGFPFEFKFIDEQYAKMYASEQRVGILSRYFAGLAILISCLGLFGLAAFTADRKKKEIGIRKVLGASVVDIVKLLTKDFTRLVLLSLLLGLPVAWFLADSWLDRFVYRIDLSIGFFVLAGVLVLLISWLTVSTQAFNSARLNPSECLQNE